MAKLKKTKKRDYTLERKQGMSRVQARAHSRLEVAKAGQQLAMSADKKNMGKGYDTPGAMKYH